MFDIPIEYSELFTIIMYFAPAIISLVVLGIKNRRFIWIAIPITIIADLIAYWRVLVYYETRQLALMFLIPQVVVVTIIAFVVMLIHKKRTAA
jgi:hypothetical protein